VAQVRKISHWNKPMLEARLSPDGHAVGFTSPVSGTFQVFVMLTSGGDPLQLTSDEGDKALSGFSSDGGEIYYQRSLGRFEVWAVPTLGGTPRKVLDAFRMIPSSDGNSLFYLAPDLLTIFRADKAGVGAEQVFKFDGAIGTGVGMLAFPEGDALLVGKEKVALGSRQLYNLNLASHTAKEIGELPADATGVDWEEPGKSLMFSHTSNGLTNIWRYTLADRSLTQVTFGAGPDLSPMPDPAGKGFYYVNGKSSGFLTVYRVHSKESMDIVSEAATQPAISPDAKRLMYVTNPEERRSELWISDIDGKNKVKVASGERLSTGFWSHDSRRINFVDESTKSVRVYVAEGDGSGVREIPWNGAYLGTSIWSIDDKALYLGALQPPAESTWKVNIDGSDSRQIAQSCGFAADVSQDGKYLLEFESRGERAER
jgi:Tol biopolymer transport system component